ncbi:MAG: hypothetical protein ACI4O8_01750 [Aristaeellaceae bacterium]
MVSVAYSQRQADAVEQLLRDEGFLVRIRALDRALSGSGVFELRVLAAEAEEARRFLMERGL